MGRFGTPVRSLASLGRQGHRLCPQGSGGRTAVARGSVPRVGVGGAGEGFPLGTRRGLRPLMAEAVRYGGGGCGLGPAGATATVSRIRETPSM